MTASVNNEPRTPPSLANPFVRERHLIAWNKDTQMLNINRRRAIRLMGAAASTLALPRIGSAQGERRSITIAVQKITNNNTLDIWNEQSNAGERVFFPNLWEGLILRDWMGDQGPVPGLATEWTRIDDKTLELKAH